MPRLPRGTGDPAEGRTHDDEGRQIGWYLRRSAWQPIALSFGPAQTARYFHAAFDAHLIGIDPVFCIHVSDRLLEIHDGPFLELGLKGIIGQMIQLPRRSEDRPDPDRLARRFEEFKKAA
jgi:hypothetical protein